MKTPCSGVVPQRRVSPECVWRPKFTSVPAVVAWLHRKGSCGDSCSDGGGVNQFVFERDGINGVRRRRKKMVAVAVCGAVPTRKEMGLQRVALLPWLTACVAEWRRSSRVSLREKEGCGVAEARCKVRVVSGGRSGGRGSDDDGSCSYGERMATGKRRRCSSRSVDEEPASCMAGRATVSWFRGSLLE